MRLDRYYYILSVILTIVLWDLWPTAALPPPGSKFGLQVGRPCLQASSSKMWRSTGRKAKRSQPRSAPIATRSKTRFQGAEKTEIAKRTAAIPFTYTEIEDNDQAQLQLVQRLLTSA